MKKQHLIGKKVRGFKFEPEDYISYNPDMDTFIGKIGTITCIGSEGNTVGVEFPGARRGWYYPIDQIEQHLIEEERPSQYEVGMTVHDYEFGEGKIKSIDKNHERLQVCVKFDEHGTFYYKVKGQLGHDPITSPPRLSLTPYDLVNGGATFPTFKPEVPEIEKGTLVFVKTGFKWEMRFFSHFDDSGNIYCFINQEKSGKAESWHEYSLTNPLKN